VGDARISLEHVKEPIRLQLYDLDLRRYRMLRQGLESIVLGRMDADGEPPRSAEVWLQPPLPPRLEVSDDGERIRPGGGSPVTIVAFCNMESPHCARLQLQLSRILPLFGTLVHYASRDMILPFHRHAESAAEAGHCALEQDKYWTFHDFMYAASPPPDRQSIQRAARAAQLDLGLFDSCLASARQRPSVAADAALARALGVDTVPAVFVNGLYAGVNPGAEQLIWLIETELKRLDVASPRQVEAQRESREALQLVALIHSRQPGQGLAMMAPVAAPDRVRSYREGDAVGTNLTVRRITRDTVEFQNGDDTEWLGFGSRPLTEAASSGRETTTESASDESAALTAAHPHRGIPVTLDRTEVLVRLADVGALEDSLVAVPMTVGGYHLLRITEIEGGSLYELLGLEQGDVMLLVNEQAIHEGENPLWNALQSEDEVRLRVMRKGGLASHFTYRFVD
jgi:protein-disulfide isomerase/type II secretory pathway component PulC